MWRDAVHLFQNYMGTGLILAIYLLCLVYLFLKEEKKYLRIAFVAVPICLLVLYFCPLFAEVVYRYAGAEIYYRILWLCPFTVVIAYTICHIYGGLKGRTRIVFACCAIGVIIASGKFVYNNPSFSKAQNMHHVPDSVIALCDAIVIPGREVMAVFPFELVQYVRQYTPLVCMPYGREALVERWDFHLELAKAMEEDTIDFEKLVPLATEDGCHYIILSEQKEIPGNPRDYGLELIDTIEGYYLYRNTNIKLELAP